MKVFEEEERMFIMAQQKIIGFAGTGVMGQGMVRNLLGAGYRVNVFNRTKQKALPLIEEGASWFDTVKGLASHSDIIITMLGYPEDVESVYFDNGVLDHAKEGTVLIDMTTSSPQLAAKISKHAKEKGLAALDAPVSGGDIGAKNGTLSIMAGGDETIFEDVLPVLETMGKEVVYQGKAGSGQHTKMCNQITIASNMMGVCESLLYAKKAGLDEKTVLRSITGGAAGSWSLTNLAPRILDEDFAPGFYVKHFIKDMKIAFESAKEMGMKAPGLELSLSLYEELAEMGQENAGTQALYELYEKKMQS